MSGQFPADCVRGLRARMRAAKKQRERKQAGPKAAYAVRGESTEERRDRLAVAGAVGPAGAVMDLALGVETQSVVHRRQEVFRGDGAVLDIRGVGVLVSVEPTWE